MQKIRLYEFFLPGFLFALRKMFQRQPILARKSKMAKQSLKLKAVAKLSMQWRLKVPQMFVTYALANADCLRSTSNPLNTNQAKVTRASCETETVASPLPEIVLSSR